MDFDGSNTGKKYFVIDSRNSAIVICCLSVPCHCTTFIAHRKSFEHSPVNVLLELLQAFIQVRQERLLISQLQQASELAYSRCHGLSFSREFISQRGTSSVHDVLVQLDLSSATMLSQRTTYRAVRDTPDEIPCDLVSFASITTLSVSSGRVAVFLLTHSVH